MFTTPLAASLSCGFVVAAAAAADDGDTLPVSHHAFDDVHLLPFGTC